MNSKNWTLLKICFTSRIELFLKYDPLQELNPFIEPFHKTQRFFCGSKNWFFFLKNYALKDWTFFYITQRMFFFDMTQRIEPSSEHKTFKNWTSFFQYDSKNWTLFLNMIHRIEPFCQIWLKELNFFWKKSTQRIELFKMIQRIEPFFFDLTQRIELSFLHVSKVWALLHDSKTWSFL